MICFCILKQIDLSLLLNLPRKGFLAGSEIFGKTIVTLSNQIFFTASTHMVKV